MDKNAQFQKALIETLKSERKKLGLSHETLSSKAGVSRQTIGKIEAGQTNPTMLTMFKITNAMGMNFEKFAKEIITK